MAFSVKTVDHLSAVPADRLCLGGKRLPRSCQVSSRRLKATIRAETSQTDAAEVAQAPSFSRRLVLLPAAVAVILGASPVGHVLADTLVAPDLETYANTTEQYVLQVPADWSKGEGTVGTRKLVAFHPEETTLTNVSVLITPLGADYTGLGSFGTVDMFAEALVNGLDRSYLRKPGQEAKLISAKSSNNMYYVEYTIRKPGEAKIHLLSAVTVNYNGIYNQLYTVTAQYLEDDAAYESTLRQVVNSFSIKK